MKSNESCQDLIRRFDELDASYSNSNLILNQPDFNSDLDNSNVFINKFNDLFNSNCSNLDETFDFLTKQKMQTSPIKDLNQIKNNEISLKFEIKNQTLKAENDELRLEIERVRSKFSAYQKKIDRYEKALFKFHRKYSDQIIEKETLSAEIVKLKSMIDSLQNCPPKTIQNREFDIESAFEKITQIIKSSMNYNEQYHQQRDSLIQIVQKQNIMIDKYEKIIQDNKGDNINSSMTTTKVNISNLSNDPISDDIDALYTVLGAVTKLATNANDASLKNDISVISENSSISVQERIIEIFRFTLGKVTPQKQNSTSINKNHQYATSNENNSLDDMKQRSLRILSVMDEELSFLQQLARSTEMQSIIFPNEGKLNISFKEQLIEHCSKLSQFIEQTLPRVSLSSEIDKLPSLNIFKNILDPSDITDKVSQIYDDIAKTEEGREIFQLFVSEVVVASILRRYAVDCKIRLDSTRRKMNEMQEAVDNSDSLAQEIKYYQEREVKMRKMLDSMFDTNPKTDFLTVFEAVLKFFRNQNENLPIISDLKTALAQTDREHSREIREIKKKCKRDIISIEKKNSSLQKQIDVLKSEKAEYQSQLDELQKKLNVTENQVKDAEKFYSRENNQIVLNLKKQNEDLQSKIQILNDQINEKDNKIIEESNNLSTLKNEILRYKKKNADLEQIAKESMNMVSVKTNQLKSSYEKTIQSLSNKIESCNILQKEVKNLTSKNNSLLNSNEQLKIENKTLSIQLQTNEDKWKNDMSSLSTQLSAQLSSATNEFSTKILQIETQIESFAKKIGYSINLKVKSNKAKDNSNKDENYFSDVFNNLASKIQKDLKFHSIYSSFYNAVMVKFKSLIDVKTPEIAINSIQSLIESNKNLQEQITQMQTKMQQDEINYQRMRQYDNENTEKLIELKRWEIWARRQFKTISGNNDNQESNVHYDHIRAMIEEEIWSSSGNNHASNSYSNYSITTNSNKNSVVNNNIDNDEFVLKRKSPQNNQYNLIRPRTLLRGVPPSE
ncbi:hypothetical protein M9Y10_028780 [Tritrichomonas musculus]|uniref:Uncharacterized protein n=1 Tax=Tritrichomonas musculus TaxID=1915356 RepID=A0ABR2KKZ0_9EUKA